jgi:hypothetical protein
MFCNANANQVTLPLLWANFGGEPPVATTRKDLPENKRNWRALPLPALCIIVGWWIYSIYRLAYNSCRK